GQPARQRRTASAACRRERLAARRFRFHVRFKRLQRPAQRRIRFSWSIERFASRGNGGLGGIAFLLELCFLRRRRREQVSLGNRQRFLGTRQSQLSFGDDRLPG